MAFLSVHDRKGALDVQPRLLERLVERQTQDMKFVAAPHRRIDGSTDRRRECSLCAFALPRVGGRLRPRRSADPSFEVHHRKLEKFCTLEQRWSDHTLTNGRYGHFFAHGGRPARRSGWEPCCWPRERRDTVRCCPTRASCSTSRAAWRGVRPRTLPSRRKR